MYEIGVDESYYGLCRIGLRRQKVTKPVFDIYGISKASRNSKEYCENRYESKQRGVCKITRRCNDTLLVDINDKSANESVYGGEEVDS